MDHTVWFKAIYFEYDEAMDLPAFVGYGLAKWCSRSVWLIPGTYNDQ